VSLEPGRRDADALLRLHERRPDRYPVLLESPEGDAPLGRYDVLLALPGPSLVLRPDGVLAGPGAVAGEEPRRFLDALDAWWRSECTQADAAAAPFGGGWFLYLGYELAAEIEPTLDVPRSRLPRAVAWRMHGAVIRDRCSGALTLHAEPGQRARLESEVAADLGDLAAGNAPTPILEGAIAVDVAEDPPERFRRGVDDVLAAIGRGDVYQANLSRGWRARLRPGATATDLYRRLRAANPAPFAGSARLPGFDLLSSSPERLLRVRDGVASTRPIAGTRPRGDSPDRDASLRAELALNEKERAEHVMLVDLGRNDLGRICRGGTVRVDEFMTIESYATVHHIVSDVRGELRPEVTPGAAIAAVFPGGTITGCPKVRCMELLAQLEGAPRDAYTGSMGYLGRDGSLDLNILIRTLTVRDGVIEFRTGAGIVADSRPDPELAETRAKARGLLRALGSES
jgi:anthranilate synthase component 1